MAKPTVQGGSCFVSRSKHGFAALIAQCQHFTATVSVLEKGDGGPRSDITMSIISGLWNGECVADETLGLTCATLVICRDAVQAVVSAESAVFQEN